MSTQNKMQAFIKALTESLLSQGFIKTSPEQLEKDYDTYRFARPSDRDMRNTLELQFNIEENQPDVDGEDCGEDQDYRNDAEEYPFTVDMDAKFGTFLRTQYLGCLSSDDIAEINETIEDWKNY